MIAILKLDYSPQLMIVSKDAVLFSHFLNPDNILTQVYQKLIDIKLEKLVVLCTPVMTAGDSDGTELVAYSFEGDNVPVIPAQDLKLLEHLCVTSNIRELQIYDINKIVTSGTKVNTIYLTQKDRDSDRIVVVENSEITQIVDCPIYETTDTIEDICCKGGLYGLEMFSVESSESILLDKYFNLISTDTESRYSTLICLASLLHKPDYKLSISKKTINHYKNDYGTTSKRDIKIIDDRDIAVSLDEEVKTLDESLKEEKVLKDSAPKNLEDSKVVLAKRVMLVLSILVGTTYGINGSMPSMTRKSKDLTTQTMSVLSPKQSTLRYYNMYNEALGAGSVNTDASTTTAIFAIPIGKVGEIKLHKDTVGVKIYLDNLSQLEAYKAKLSKIINIKDVLDSGTATSGDKVFYKFVISGTLL